MNNDLSVMKIAGAMARHAALRHKVVSENIANADTPRFKAKELPAFDGERVQRTQAITDQSLKLFRMMQANDIENASASPNGNTVSVEEQIARGVDSTAQHGSALMIYRKSLDFLRLSMSARR